MNLKKRLKKNLNNIRGDRIGRKVLVIESDDWGAVRMPSKEILGKINNYGIKTDRCHYVSNDSLASEQDLNLLFDLLIRFNDKFDNHPVFTANVILANPDFEKIKEAHYKKYFYETFTDTLKRYPEHEHSFELWKKGISKNLFHPQFHGREHLQVSRWLKQVNHRESDTAKVFDDQVYGLSTSVTSEKRRSYLAAYDVENQEELDFVKKSIREGLNQFQNLFGYASLSSIAPNYTWNKEVEEVLKEMGVRYLQGGTVQRSPDLATGENRNIRHFMGETNSLGQTYLIRNCKFEPSSDSNKDWVDSCLSDIEAAFRWKKPAIIESHRVNYIGYINTDNRDRNLKLLEELLNRILKKWPEVEFMTSDQLGMLIENKA